MAAVEMFLPKELLLFVSTFLTPHEGKLWGISLGFPKEVIVKHLNLVHISAQRQEGKICRVYLQRTRMKTFARVARGFIEIREASRGMIIDAEDVLPTRFILRADVDLIRIYCQHPLRVDIWLKNKLYKKIYVLVRNDKEDTCVISFLELKNGAWGVQHMGDPSDNGSKSLVSNLQRPASFPGTEDCPRLIGGVEVNVVQIS